MAANSSMRGSLEPDNNHKFLIRNKKYPEIISKHNLRLTQERLENFRGTMKEIIDIKNGKKMEDVELDRSKPLSQLD